MFIQHGYGKGDKLDALLPLGGVDGIVLSPSHEDQSTLGRLVERAEAIGAPAMIDPQSYFYSTVPRHQGRKHELNNLDFTTFSPSNSPSQLQEMVWSVGSLNEAVNPRGMWIAPAPLRQTLSRTDDWRIPARQLAAEAATAWGADKTIASLVLDETALEDWDNVERLLDEFTNLDLAGFYLLVSHGVSTYPPTGWSVNVVTNLLRLVFVLSELNQYKVYFGHADVLGLVTTAAGVTSFGSGWTNTLRQFNSKKWTNPQKGGASPIHRHFVKSLLTPIRIDSEGAPLLDRNLSFSSPPLDETDVELLKGTNVNSSVLKDRQLDHLTALSEIDCTIKSTARSLTEKADLIGERIGMAKKILEEARVHNIELEPTYLGFINTCQISLENFRDLEGV